MSNAFTVTAQYISHIIYTYFVDTGFMYDRHFTIMKLDYKDIIQEIEIYGILYKIIE